MPEPINLNEVVLEAVDAREGALLAFLETIVNMESPTESKALTDRVGDVLERQARELGFTTERDPQPVFADNRICRHVPKQPQGLPRVLLIGHFDTVHGEGSIRDWPFRIADGRAFGPGVFDMKGGLAIGLFALEALREAYGEIPLPTTFIFNSDEEIGSPESRRIILAETAKHDLALILEPGLDGPALTIGRKGVGIWHIDVEGIEAHAGMEPEKGANSIVEAAHKTVAVQALQDMAAGTSVTPGVVAGGTKPYVVPGRTRVTTDIRVTTAAEQSRVTEGLERVTAETHVPGTRATLTGSFHRPPMEPSAASMRHVKRVQAFARALGFAMGAERCGGASDANLTAAAGTPSVDGLGPHGGRAHSREEYLEVASLRIKTRILASFLASLVEDARPRSA